MRKLIEYKLQGGFNGCNFAAYTHPSTGEIVMWKDQFGNDMPDGPSIGRKVVLVSDVKGEPGFNPKAHEIIAYFQDHPTFKTKFNIRDLDAIEKSRLSKIRNKSSILATLYRLSEDDLRKVLIVGRQDVKGKSLLKMHDHIQVVADSQNGVEELYRWVTAKDKEYKTILYMAIQEKIINFNNNRYTLGDGNVMIGYTEDTVIRWMQENEKDYEYLLKSLGVAPVEAPKAGAKKPKSAPGVMSLEDAAKSLQIEEDDAVETIVAGPAVEDKSYLELENEMSDMDMLMAANRLS